MDDTIAAIATALGEASIGVVRLSGSDAIPIADRLFRSARGTRLGQVPTFTVHHGWLAAPATGQPVDEVLATVMRAPHSYTREDIVEFSGHGGVVGVRKILDAVLEAGARLAEPGEFTKRAFLSGRIDLAQAEAVLQLIRATHEAAHSATVAQLRGGMSEAIQALRQQLLMAQAHLEVSVDFPGEEHAVWSRATLAQALDAALVNTRELLTDGERGRQRAQGYVAVICGRPNVGKSSLLNAMLRRDRAIVSPIPGTTRDTIEELMIVDGLPIRLVDTAGLGEPDDPLEAAGVARGHAALQDADAALWVVDGSEALQAQDRAVAELIRHRRVVVALNKMDRPPRVSPVEVHQALPEVPIVPVAATTRHGVPALETQLVAVLRQGQPLGTETPLVTNARHLEALRKVAAALQRAQAAVTADLSPELLVMDVREALDQLGAITGETVSDELLTTVFSHFCIGK